MIASVAPRSRRIAESPETFGCDNPARGLTGDCALGRPVRAYSVSFPPQSTTIPPRPDFGKGSPMAEARDEELKLVMSADPLLVNASV